MMDRIGNETTQTVHYFQIDGSRSMTPAALLSALQEMAISHSRQPSASVCSIILRITAFGLLSTGI